MAKRFIDTKIWDKAWYRKLDPKNKLIWIYLLTKCDHAGIWDMDWEAAEFFIGDKIDLEDIPMVIWDKMVLIKRKKNETVQYFIPSFIDYQYGILKENSKPHLSVIKRLGEKNLKTFINNSIITLKDKDKDKDKDMDKREEEFKEGVVRIFKEKEYDKKEMIKFMNFWTEKNSSKTRMRFELQKTWDTGRRISNWINNNNNWNKGKNNERKKMQFKNG